jgi:hypothetical protein
MPERRHDAGTNAGGEESPPSRGGGSGAEPCVPDALVDAAKAAWEHRYDEGEIAVIVADSAAGADLESMPGTDVELRFHHPALDVAVRVVGGPEGSTVHGSIGEAPTGSVLLEHYSGAAPIDTTVTAGEFSFGVIPHGLVRLRVVRAAAPSIRTEWFRL